MTAKDLIKLLKRFPQDAEVYLSVNSMKYAAGSIKATSDQDSKWTVYITNLTLPKVAETKQK